MLVYITILILCQLVGEVLSRGFGLPVPGPVLGMLILFMGLVIAGRVPDDLDKVANGLLSHLSVMFIPAGVGVSLYAGLIWAEILPISLAVLLGTLITIAVTGWVMARLGRGGGA